VLQTLQMAMKRGQPEMTVPKMYAPESTKARGVSVMCSAHCKPAGKPGGATTRPTKHEAPHGTLWWQGPATACWWLAKCGTVASASRTLRDRGCQTGTAGACLSHRRKTVPASLPSFIHVTPSMESHRGWKKSAHPKGRRRSL